MKQYFFSVFRIFFFLILLFLSGCSGKRIVKTELDQGGVPPELIKAFEVKEIGSQQTLLKPKKKIEKKKSKKKRAPLIASGKPLFSIPNRRPKVDPLWIGEKIWMDVSWLNTTAGEFLLEVNPLKDLNGRKVYDIKGTAKTSTLFSLIYKAEDWVQTFVDYEGWFPYKFVLHGDETRYVRNNLELFDHESKKQFVRIYSKRLDNGELKEEQGYKDLVPLSQDSLSALYFARTQNFVDGEWVRFPMTTQGKQWETTLLVLGREDVKTNLGYIRAIKTRVETRFNGELQQRGDSFIWFSDDQRHFPIKFEAKVKIGWVEGLAKQIIFGEPPVGEVAATTIVPLPQPH